MQIFNLKLMERIRINFKLILRVFHSLINSDQIKKVGIIVDTNDKNKLALSSLIGSIFK